MNKRETGLLGWVVRTMCVLGLSLLPSLGLPQGLAPVCGERQQRCQDGQPEAAVCGCLHRIYSFSLDSAGRLPQCFKKRQTSYLR